MEPEEEPEEKCEAQTQQMHPWLWSRRYTRGWREESCDVKFFAQEETPGKEESSLDAPVMQEAPEAPEAGFEHRLRWVECQDCSSESKEYQIQGAVGSPQKSRGKGPEYL